MERMSSVPARLRPLFDPATPVQQVARRLEAAGHDEPSGEGDVVYSPRGCWHGFNNTSNEDVVLVWGWMGAGSIEASGYEVAPDDH